VSDILTLIGSHVFELASVIGIIGALFVAARQNSLTSRAIRAQSFVDLLELEIQSGFQRGIQAITSLGEYTSFAAFEAGETQET
jgi:hypothetical protein